MQAALELAKQDEQRFLDELFDFLAIPSVSTEPKHKADVSRCATYVADHLKSIGIQKTKIVETEGHPVVYGHYHQSDELNTVLIYGHYDVQPADPYDLWESAPFKAEIRDDFIYARGVADNKGQIFCHMKAVEAYLKTAQPLPVNVIFLIEGEEEIGSPNLAAFIAEYKESLKADVALVSDSPMFAKQQPALCFSLRGMLYLELTVKGPNIDLHSGQYGGVLQNPIQALATIIARLKDDDDQVRIPGFYDDVSPLSDEIREHLKQVLAHEPDLKKELEVPDLVGPDGYSISEKKWLRPTLDCNGIVGGYIKEGAKTIIPSQASAKISMRLVDKQDPEDIYDKFQTYVRSIAPKGVTIDIQAHTFASPATMSIESEAMKAAEKAFEDSYSNKPFYVGEGGTIPVIADFKHLLGIDTVMMGLNLPDDGIHSPNERFGLENLFKGIESSIRFLAYYGAKK